MKLNDLSEYELFKYYIENGIDDLITFQRFREIVKEGVDFEREETNRKNSSDS